MSAYLRHPHLQKPYFYEFHHLASQIDEVFDKSICYDQYFLGPESLSPNFLAYFRLLASGAKGRAVFQECRSAGRVAWLQRNFGGTHLFLWRNPHDQWWSYRVDGYFDRANLLILNAASAPAIFVELRSKLGIAEFHDTDLERELQHFDAYCLNPEQSYRLFFALWLHAVLEARPLCSAEISIDELSASREYRTQKSVELASLGLEGLDFADCRSPVAEFTPQERQRFFSSEQAVGELFRDHGYTAESVDSALRLAHQPIRVLGQEREPPRLRELLLRRQAELAIYSGELRKLKAELERERLEVSASRNELAVQEGRLQKFQLSASWRLTAPLRALRQLVVTR